eukprot:SAG31_NODE_4427_length_3241_cov_1.992680_4_plen_51_part_00
MRTACGSTGCLLLTVTVLLPCAGEPLRADAYAKLARTMGPYLINLATAVA